MADLNYREKLLIEKLFGMGLGNVMDFSNRTFQEFVYDSLKINIYDTKYDYNSGSKANRLRAFFDIESNYKVGLLLKNFLEYWRTKYLIGESEFDFSDEKLHEECCIIAERLKQGMIVDEMETIREIDDDRDFSLLAKSIKESIEKNEPEVALDRLHTYVMKRLRQLCSNHNLEVTREESLNALFGKYIKFIIQTGHIESQMSERILKYSIHVLEAFNDIRNNKSLAHDNKILNYEESILIFNNVTNTIKFIETIEEKIENSKMIQEKGTENETADWNDLPF